MRWIWPIQTGYTFFDYWSVAHWSFWFFIGSTLAALTQSYRLVALSACMGLAFGWEIFEVVAEKQWPTIWLSPESFLNRWVSDPLMCLLAIGIAFYGYDHWRP